jgi:SAM-dependent methyltransferase
MTRTPAENARLARFAKEYEVSQNETVLAVERAVCGCDYGGTSWTTRAEAQLVARMLSLAPGVRFLDLGAGAGWPGLYMAWLSGCDAALIDIPLEGLRIAAHRAARDGLSGACWPIRADAAWLPLRSGAFDAIGHSDLLCCLQAKSAVLSECRRVVRPAGMMVFSVIQIAPGLSAADQRRAMEAGPLFKDTATGYPALLEQTGWRITDHRDVTAEYALAAQRILVEEEARADALVAVHGEAEFTQILGRRRRTLAALGRGLLRRDLIAARPAGPGAIPAQA